MNEQEYNKWRTDAAMALMCRYSIEQVRAILNWFDNIKGEGERGLIGEARLNAFAVFSAEHPSDGKWTLYDSMMARLFIYAPYIVDKFNATE